MKYEFVPETITEKLRVIADKYPSTSEDYSALTLAAKSILFIYISNQQESFQRYLEEMDQELTPEMKNYLITVGINV